jgi:hypothetical protein
MAHAAAVLRADREFMEVAVSQAGDALEHGSPDVVRRPLRPFWRPF